jgi:hypothetical protein
MRVAIAPLKASAKSAIPEEVKGGALAKLAGQLCADPAFQAYLECDSDESAAEAVRKLCGVASRAELDHNAEAADRFHRLIRKPWMEFNA